MHHITAFALNRSRVAMILMAIIAVLGVLQFLDHPRQEDPSIVIREAVVTAAFPGMPVERVEDLITRKLEEQIRTISAVDEINSESKAGASIVHVTLRDEVPSADIDAIWQDLRNDMNDVAPDLPDGTIGPYVNDERGLTAVATVALWADGFSLAEMRAVARDLRDVLYTVTGIKKIELFGVQDEEVYLKFSNAKLAQYGMSPTYIIDALQTQNVILPGGRIDVRGQDVFVQPSGNFESVRDIEEVLIAIPGSDQLARLSDVMSVERGYADPPDKPVYFRAKPAIVLSVSMLDGFNSVAFGDRLTRTIQEFEFRLPIGYVLEYATYQPELVESVVNGALLNVYQSLAIVLLVVMAFLGWRTGLIVGSFVPMAMLLAVLFMALFGIDFNRISVATMIIALGLLVDNGIVVTEDIRTRMERGEERKKACLEAGRTLSIPLLTSTLTTILAFVPMLMVKGAAGEFVAYLGQVIIIVLLGSWFLSMYMTPAMCFWFMKVRAPQPKRATAVGADISGPYDARLYRLYRALLERLLRTRPLVIAIALIALVAAGYGFRLVIQEFFPKGDRNQFLAYIDLPAGSNTNMTADVVRRYTAWLEDETANPDVTSSIAYVGSGGPRFFLSLSPIDPDPHVAFVVVNTRSNDDVPAAVRRSRERLLAAFPEVRARVKAMWLGPTETGLVEVRLSGSDAEELRIKAEVVTSALNAIPGTLDAKHDWDNPILKVNVLVDQARARRAGITSEDVALSLNAAFDGAEITDYREGDTVIPVVVRAVDEERAVLPRLRDMSIYSLTQGISVPLSQIADFRPEWDFSKIKRRDQERTITVSAKHQFLKAGQLIAALQPTLDTLDLAPGHRWELGGELEKSGETQGKLFANAPFALAVMVVLLIWQFNSFRRPLIIGLTVPLSLIGGVVGLLVMNSVFGFMTLLGVFSLAGIIINNGIVLIDRIDSYRKDGMAPYDAVVNASLSRLRPIAMTTLTTVLGLLPLIIFRDPLFYGMASLIAFGLLIGTLLTLGVVPVLYTLFFGIKTAPESRVGEASATT